MGTGQDRVEEPQWWVFTFGCGQEHAGHYVRIFGTFWETRREMISRYGQEWAFQYTQDEWCAAMEEFRLMGRLVETELKEDGND